MVLTLREYGFPLLLAAVLHAAILFMLASGWNPSDQISRAIKPHIVHATLLMLEPKAKPIPKKTPPKIVQRAEPEPETTPIEIQTEPKPDPDAQRLREQADQQARRRELLEALAQSSFLDALEVEATDLAENNAANQAEIVVQSYRYGVYQRIVSNWSRPPSARNGMQTTLQVELVPTGDVVAVMLLEGSGNDAFDRSAEAAVRKSRKFDVPVESDIFERHFRRFTLLFKPEDLLR
ncbi:MAG: cell envelope integrity protein TolA [Pseudomonadales bacterium]